MIDIDHRNFQDAPVSQISPKIISPQNQSDTLVPARMYHRSQKSPAFFKFSCHDGSECIASSSQVVVENVKTKPISRPQKLFVFLLPRHAYQQAKCSIFWCVVPWHAERCINSVFLDLPNFSMQADICAYTFLSFLSRGLQYRPDTYLLQTSLEKLPAAFHLKIRLSAQPTLRLGPLLWEIISKLTLPDPHQQARIVDLKHNWALRTQMLEKLISQACHLYT